MTCIDFNIYMHIFVFFFFFLASYFFCFFFFFFFSSRRRHTRSKRDWSSDVCSSDLFSHVKRSVKSDFEEHVSTAAAVLNMMLLLGCLKFQSVDPTLAYIALLDRKSVV